MVDPFFCSCDDVSRMTGSSNLALTIPTEFGGLNSLTYFDLSKMTVVFFHYVVCDERLTIAIALY